MISIGQDELRGLRAKANKMMCALLQIGKPLFTRSFLKIADCIFLIIISQQNSSGNLSVRQCTLHLNKELLEMATMVHFFRSCFQWPA